MSSAESPPRGTCSRPAGEAEQRIRLDRGWQVARCAPDAHTDPGLPESLDWIPARVPGTAAAALLAAGRWQPGQPNDFDGEDWWFRTSFHAEAAQEGEEVTLELDGIATVSEVFLNGVCLLCSESMFAAHELDVGALLRGENELAIRCCALSPLLRQRRKPRARWRQRLVDGSLRFHRTMLLGRAPGFAPGPAAVGPWRPVRLVRRHTVAVRELTLRASLTGEEQQPDGLLAAHLRMAPLGGHAIEAAEMELAGPSGEHLLPLALEVEAGESVAYGTLRLPAVERWWPHTHGDPVLHEVRIGLRVGGSRVALHAGRVGFRSLAAGLDPQHDVKIDGLDLHVNGTRTFARGAVWTSPDPVGLAPEPGQLRAALERARDAGMNMLRIPGTAAYESSEFHDLCDELGLLVWQDFMFANLDYPIADQEFRATIEREVRAQLAELGARPSLAVLCGNSEIEQQVAMLGLDPALGRGELFGSLLPGLVVEAQADAIYVPSAPCGGTLPFRPDQGVANYYGVGGYRRPLQDARRCQVRFAAECLAFSNVPDETGVKALFLDAPNELAVHHPRWKAGVPRDAGPGWDFEDVRDHYLKTVFEVDPGELRRFDQERYLDLSRAVTGEVMAEVMGEWRRAGSPCGGALVLWLADLAPGAGWGVIDHSGKPKPAYHHLRRALAPVAVWTTDEGLGGVRIHVANDRSQTLSARLRVALYRDLELCVEQASEQLTLPGHATCERDLEALIGHFVDASWSYRFGPPGHDVIVATLEHDGEGETEPPKVLSQAFRFPAGRPLRRESAARLGMQATLERDRDGTAALRIVSRRLAYGVRVHVDGHSPTEDAVTLEPGVARTIALLADDAARPEPPAVSISALNLEGRLRPATE